MVDTVSIQQNLRNVRCWLRRDILLCRTNFVAVGVGRAESVGAQMTAIVGNTLAFDTIKQNLRWHW